MAHRSVIDCDWCGAKDVPAIIDIRLKAEEATFTTPMGARMVIPGEADAGTWVEVCEDCAEIAEAAIRLWAREETAYRVMVMPVQLKGAEAG